MESRPLLNLTSGYVTRAAADLPKQSAAQPWMIQHDPDTGSENSWSKEE